MAAGVFTWAETRVTLGRDDPDSQVLRRAAAAPIYIKNKPENRSPLAL